VAYEVGWDDVVGVDDVHQCDRLAKLRGDGRVEQVVDTADDPLSRQLPVAGYSVKLGARYQLCVCTHAPVNGDTRRLTGATDWNLVQQTYCVLLRLESRSCHVSHRILLKAIVIKWITNFINSNIFV